MNDSTVSNNFIKIISLEAPAAPDVETFFSPRTVAVIGASPKSGNQGGRIVQSLAAHGFAGRIIPVHPKGMPIPPFSSVRSVAELPKGTDLAIAAVPARNVPGLVEPLAKKGIRHLIVISGGFAETGAEGEKLQEALKTAARKFRVRVMGPNAMGVFSAPDHVNTFFLSPDEISLPKSGPIALISQSGAFMSMILDRFAGLGIGVQRAANFGNRVDVGETELLETFAADPEVRVIGLYLESLQDAPRFIKAARRVGREKPVVIWKGGQAKRGSDAAHAHSASLAGPYNLFQAACAKAGMIETRGFEEFTETLEALALQPPAKGRRVLIVSNGGGMAVFLTDLCEQAGLSIPQTSPSDQDRLKQFLPEYFSLRNPIDLTGSGTNEQCIQTVEYLLGTGEYDALLMVLLPGAAGITSKVVPLFRNRLPKHLPVVVGAYGKDMMNRTHRLFIEDGVPVFTSAEAAVRALGRLVERGNAMEGDRVTHPAIERRFIASALGGWSKWPKHSPNEMEVKKLLQLCDVPVPPNRHLETEEDLELAAAQFDFPMTLKVVGENITHKTEIKGIRLNIPWKEQLKREWETLSHIWPGSIWAEKQMPAGLDLMVGGHRDPRFGPVLLFGSGGTHVEILNDIERVLLPAEDEELYRMIFKTHAGKILKGVRGEHELDIERLMDFLKLAAEWMVREPIIESLDFNPVRLYENGLVVLDAKVALRHD